MTLVELHLFAGIGGGILGGALLGHRCVAAVELDPYCRRVLEARQRDGCLEPFPIFRDVRSFDGRAWRGVVDVVCGGFPCQPWSSAGKRLGTADPRHLWPEMARIVGQSMFAVAVGVGIIPSLRALLRPDFFSQPSIPNSNTMAHALFAPSASSRWLACPGSVMATKGMSPPDTPDSLLGTFAHSIADKCLKSNADAAAMIGTTDGVHTVDAVMAANLQQYLDAVRAVAMLADTTPQSEVKVFVSQDCNGTVDAYVFDKFTRTLHVFDLKYGAGNLVPAVDNTQMRVYALGLLPQFARQVDTVTLHIVQPRRADENGETHREWSVPVQALGEFGRTVTTAIDTAQKPDAPFAAGTHCKYCPIAGTCETLRNHAAHEAGLIFASTAITEAPLRMQPPAPAALSPADIGRALTMADTIEGWLKAVREHALNELKRGKTIPGWTLVDSIGHRKWLDESHAATALQGAGLADPWTRELISPAEVERRIGKNKRSKMLLDLLTNRPVTGVRLAPESSNAPRFGATAAHILATTPLDDPFAGL